MPRAVARVRAAAAAARRRSAQSSICSRFARALHDASAGSSRMRRHMSASPLLISDTAAGAFQMPASTPMPLSSSSSMTPRGAGFMKIHGREIRQRFPGADGGEAMPKVRDDPGARCRCPSECPGTRVRIASMRVRDIRVRERLVAVRVADVHVNRRRARGHGGACLRGLLCWCHWDGWMLGACSCAVEGRLDHHRPTFSITAPYTRCP